MLVIGFGLGWLGYGLAFWGYSMVKGYNLSFSDVFSPGSYYKGTWPPALAPDTVLIPNGKAGASTAGTTSGVTKQGLSSEGSKLNSSPTPGVTTGESRTMH
jgi:hypothetical protein